jgi:hypothetical protein
MKFTTITSALASLATFVTAQSVGDGPYRPAVSLLMKGFATETDNTTEL